MENQKLAGLDAIVRSSAMLKTPNRPLEMAYPEEGERTYTCYTAPGVVFATEEEMKEHERRQKVDN